MLKKVSKNTVAAQVINQLTELIRDGSLRPGDRLPSEREMAEQLGVSRPPLRESLRALEYAGIIETKYGDGIYVKSNVFPSDIDPTFSNLLNHYTLEEMVEMRKVVERAAVRFAMERGTSEDLDVLREINVKTHKSVGNKEKFIECDFAFHSYIAEMARNSLLFKTVKTMRKLMSEFNRELLDSRTFRVNVDKQHHLIFDAMEKKNVEAALTAMDKHLDNVVNLAMLHHGDEAKANISGKDAGQLLAHGKSSAG